MPFLPSFSVPLRSTSKEGKNIIPNFDFIFYLKWVTSIYNADNVVLSLGKTLEERRNL